MDETLDFSFNQYLTKVFTTVAIGLGVTALASFLMNVIFPNLQIAP